MPTGFYRVVGALEVAGVAGLLLGLTWTPLGVAAAPGLAPDMTSAAEEIAVRRLTKSSPPAPITTPMTQ
jgi:hypothetical protein